MQNGENSKNVRYISRRSSRGVVQEEEVKRLIGARIQSIRLTYYELFYLLITKYLKEKVSLNKIFSKTFL